MTNHARLYLSSPHMGGDEAKLVQEAFATNWIAPLGPHVDKFETEFVETLTADTLTAESGTGPKHALNVSQEVTEPKPSVLSVSSCSNPLHAAALSSGTAALHLALRMLGVGEGDEVFVSTLTFSASVNPIAYERARPVFIDSERASWNMDPARLAEALEDRAKMGRLPKAVIVVHLYGQSADLDPIVALCEKYNVPLIEDAAEALGALYYSHKRSREAEMVNAEHWPEAQRRVADVGAPRAMADTKAQKGTNAGTSQEETELTEGNISSGTPLPQLSPVQNGSSLSHKEARKGTITDVEQEQTEGTENRTGALPSLASLPSVQNALGLSHGEARKGTKTDVEQEQTERNTSFGTPLSPLPPVQIGSRIGIAPGTVGRMGIFSFNGNKIITTSGGGMLVSPDEALIKKARFLATQARDPAPHYQHSEIGFNYRMSNVLAGIGRGQLRVLKDRVEARRANCAFYQKAFADLPGIEFMPEPAWSRSTRWLTCILVDPEKFGADREKIRLALEAENIESRPVWKPMHLQPVFAGCDKFGGEVAEDLFTRGLCLPSGSNLTESDLQRVVDVVRRVAKH